MVKYLRLENLDPKPDKGFKPLFFRITNFDTSKRFNSVPKGIGSFAYFSIKGTKVSVLRTDNYFKALNKNYRALDITPPKGSQIRNMDTVEFVKYKLLRSLENFVHFLTRALSTNNTEYFTRLSRKIRYWLRTFAFKAAFLAMLPFCKGKPGKPTKLVDPFPSVIQHRVSKPAKPGKSKLEQTPKAFDPYDESQFDELSSSNSSKSRILSSESSSRDDSY